MTDDAGVRAGEEGNCVEAVHQLYHFLDGELTEERRTAIRHHLDDCGPCLEAFDFEAELRIMISARCRDEVPPELRARIAALIHHEAAAGDGEHGRTPPGPVA